MAPDRQASGSRGGGVRRFGVFFLVQIVRLRGRLALRPEVGRAGLTCRWCGPTPCSSPLYTTVLHGQIGGQTLGKMLMGVRVMGVEGGMLSFGAALLRFIGYFASLASLGLGFGMAGLRPDKRALHDLLAGSCVVRVARARGPAPTMEPAAPSSAG
jgi:uncharacterized RDD family membrane protein YckC